MNQRPILKALSPALLTQLVNSLIGLFTSFAIITITDPQQQAINNFLAVLGLLLTGAGLLIAEGQVTPVASPVLPQGTAVTVVTPGTEPNTTTTV